MKNCVGKMPYDFIILFVLIIFTPQFILAYKYDTIDLGVGAAYGINEYGEVVGTRKSHTFLSVSCLVFSVFHLPPDP